MELMVVLAILAVLIVLSFPVYHAARQRGNVTRSIHNLKQIHLALQLYAETHGQNSPLGFGLPHAGHPVLDTIGMIPYEILRTRGCDFLGPPGSDIYIWFPPGLPFDSFDPGSPDMRAWQGHVERTQGNPVLMLDVTHNTFAQAHDPFYPKLCITLWADGTIKTSRRRGIVAMKEAWE